MAGKVISTVDMKETILAGKDRNLEIKKPDLDFPLKETDQSLTCSTHNIIPNKRPLLNRDVRRFVKRLKDDKKVKIEEKKKGRPKKETTNKE